MDPSRPTHAADHIDRPSTNPHPRPAPGSGPGPGPDPAPNPVRNLRLNLTLDLNPIINQNLNPILNHNPNPIRNQDISAILNQEPSAIPNQNADPNLNQNADPNLNQNPSPNANLNANTNFILSAEEQREEEEQIRRTQARATAALALVYHTHSSSGYSPCNDGGVTALNAVLQGPYFDEQTLAALSAGGPNDAYSLNAALRSFDLSLEPNRTVTSDPSMEPEANAYLCFQHNHWFALRRIGAHWLNLNERIFRPGQVPFASIGTSISELEQDGCRIYKVTGQLPDCEAESSGLFDEHFEWLLHGGLGPRGAFRGIDDHMYEDGRLCDGRMYDDRRVYDEGRVYNGERIYGDGRMCGDGEMYEAGHTYDDGRIYEDGRMCDDDEYGYDDDYDETTYEASDSEGEQALHRVMAQTSTDAFEEDLRAAISASLEHAQPAPRPLVIKDSPPMSSVSNDSAAPPAAPALALQGGNATEERESEAKS